MSAQTQTTKPSATNANTESRAQSDIDALQAGLDLIAEELGDQMKSLVERIQFLENQGPASNGDAFKLEPGHVERLKAAKTKAEARSVLYDAVDEAVAHMAQTGPVRKMVHLERRGAILAAGVITGVATGVGVLLGKRVARKAAEAALAADAQPEAGTSDDAQYGRV